MRRPFLLLLIVLLLSNAGCTKQGPERVPVSGVVLIDGKPLTYGVVHFAPAGSRPSTGRLDAQGRFTLSSYKTGDGVTIGTHKVTVDASEEVGNDARKWHAPKKYASLTTSDLRAKVDGPSDEIKIELSWDGKSPFVENSY